MKKIKWIILAAVVVILAVVVFIFVTRKDYSKHTFKYMDDFYGDEFKSEEERKKYYQYCQRGHDVASGSVGVVVEAVVVEEPRVCVLAKSVRKRSLTLFFCSGVYLVGYCDGALHITCKCSSSDKIGQMCEFSAVDRDIVASLKLR